MIVQKMININRISLILIHNMWKTYVNKVETQLCQKFIRISHLARVNSWLSQKKNVFLGTI